MIELQKMLFSNRVLSHIKQAERNWVLFLGHVANEIMLLQKLLLWTNPRLEDNNDPRAIAASAQAMFLAKLLLGKEWEAYSVLKESYLSNPLRKALEPRMNPKLVELTARIHSSFSDPTSIYAIVRNRFTFHYSLNEFGRQFQAARKAEPLVVLYGNTRGNTLYAGSEVIINRAMLNTIDADEKTAMVKITNAAVDGAVWLSDFCDGFIEAVLGGRSGENIRLEPLQTDGPEFESVHIPWFTEAPVRRGRPEVRGV